jgi:uncharacterized DUF497 family protein
VNFEFDPGKSEINKAKHGLTLEAAQALWSTPGVEADLGMVNGEYRYVRLGPIGTIIHIAIFTFRPRQTIRLISARTANSKEIQIYEQSRKRK